jgi:hypothetical protein
MRLLSGQDARVLTLLAGGVGEGYHWLERLEENTWT